MLYLRTYGTVVIEKEIAAQRDGRNQWIERRSIRVCLHLEQAFSFCSITSPNIINTYVVEGSLAWLRTRWKICMLVNPHEKSTASYSLKKCPSRLSYRRCCKSALFVAYFWKLKTATFNQSLKISARKPEDRRLGPRLLIISSSIVKQ